MNDVIEFSAEDKFVIPRRGVTYVGPCPDCLDGRSRDDNLIGRLVRMDGGLYRVRGFERHLVMGPLRAGESVGFMLEPVE